MKTFGANAYTDSAADPKFHLDQVPPTSGLRIDLNYIDGSHVVLIYDQVPNDREQRDLMLKLQLAAARNHFTVTRTEADGTVIQAAGIG